MPSIAVPKMPALSGHHTGIATQRYRAGDAFPDNPTSVSALRTFATNAAQLHHLGNAK
jgi:hypothetical protein